MSLYSIKYKTNKKKNVLRARWLIKVFRFYLFNFILFRVMVNKNIIIHTIHTLYDKTQDVYPLCLSKRRKQSCFTFEINTKTTVPLFVNLKVPNNHILRIFTLQYTLYYNLTSYYVTNISICEISIGSIFNHNIIGLIELYIFLYFINFSLNNH